jgi:predicted site-specific integrase-resolvase
MEETTTTGQAAGLLSITVKTLQRWERESRLVPATRTASNRRRYTESQLRAFLRMAAAEPRRVVAYCRVSSAAQRPDPANQRRVLEQFAVARGLAGVEFVEEVGGGLNFGRKRFLALMDAIGRGKLAVLVLAHSDRLTRLRYDWFAHYAALHGCELLVLNQERLSPEQDVAQDLMTIVDCFSSRLYGLRNYRRQLRAALESDHAAGAPDQD